MGGRTDKSGGERGPERFPLIHPLLRDRPPHPAPGVVHVAGIPGDDVDVEVHHGLAGGGADVHADVVAVGMELFVEEGLCLPDEGEEGGELRVGRVEEGGDVAEGDEEEPPRIPVYSLNNTIFRD